MGLFSSKPDPKEVRAFGRGKQTSAKAAEEYAKRARDREGKARAARAIKAAKKGK